MLINYALLPTLCELGSGRTFAEAATRLRLTPSAVSHQMRALEAQVGFRLFERVGRRATLTPEAQRLVSVIADHLPPIDEALEALLDDGTTVRGGVRIGGALPFSRLWLRPRVTRLMRRYPELRLSLSFGPPSALLPRLHSGLLDLVIMAEQVESPLLAARQIFVEEFWAVCSERYLAGAAAPASVKELQQQRFIVYDENRPMHDAWWRSVAGKKSVAPADIACSVANLDEMLHLCEMGFGVAVLPNYLVSEAVARGKLVRLLARRMAPQNPVHVVWRKNAIETSRFKVVHAALIAPKADMPK
jgi:LysR family glycine cleavage system transcriptional activator